MHVNSVATRDVIGVARPTIAFLLPRATWWQLCVGIVCEGRRATVLLLVARGRVAGTLS